MNIIHRPDIDYISIDFKDEVEASSFFENGVIVRLDKKKNVIGIDITNSSDFFAGKENISLKEACKLLNISESTMRRWIKSSKIKYTKPNNREYQFKKNDVLKLAAQQDFFNKPKM